ncbi:NAD(P)/FAD-dependent oxidoreductase [Aciduricibacillus chroicocephali]|uniref:NAD(P)/FAD-dependent oxidoreductase n=1 Tax=Aciduricibacillus chroicocephali TaxID=3054939 RepID=A0ABY9KXE8_9BACI|nr:NAD(P)/FAD-dependent oxidoreductase [Bacillaceae bacterium 44XB]
MTERYDAIIIGSGPAGSQAAAELGRRNWKVAIIEEDGFGGTCPLRGCNPKKIMAAVTEFVTKNAQLQGAGLVSDTRIDWKELIQYKRKFIEPVPKAKEKSLRQQGVETIHGKASFVNDKTIRVAGRELMSEKILIATGAKPAKLPIDGLEHLATSDDFLELETLPKRLIFIGGGYISFEFAHIAARSGADVTILQRGDRVLEGFEHDFVDILVKESEKIGIRVECGQSAKRVEKVDGGYKVITETGDTEAEWEGDLVIAAAGRSPNIDELNLEDAKVKYDKSGIIVNPFMQSTTNPYVYSAGDVASTGAPQLTPIAGYDASVVIENWIRGNERKTVYQDIPSVVFTYPALGEVGMSVAEAKEKGSRVKINEYDLSNWFSYKIVNDQAARAKVIINRATGEILGAHIISGEADQLINMFALCIQLKIKAEDIRKVIYAFPSPGSDMQSLTAE